MRYVSLGFELLASILVPILIGRWIDTSQELEFPYATLTGALFGCIAAIYLMIRTYKESQKPKD